MTLDANQTVGTVSFNSSQSYTLAGSNTLTLDNGADAPQITDGSGSHAIGANLAIVGSNAAQVNVVSAADTLTISGRSRQRRPGEGRLGRPGAVSGANTYTGANTVDLGTLPSPARAPSAIPPTPSPSTMPPSSTLAAPPRPSAR